MKTLTAEDAHDTAELCRAHLWQDNACSLDAIASGAHEVIDRATTRGVSVETLLAIRKLIRHDISCDKEDYPRTGICTCSLSAALAEIEEKLRDA